MLPAGDGSSTGSSRPVPVVGLSSGVASVATGCWHSCARLTTGGVKCWGNNNDGEFGTATITNSNTPVTTFTSGVINLASAGFHVCAVMNTGATFCWYVKRPAVQSWTSWQDCCLRVVVLLQGLQQQRWFGCASRCVVILRAVPHPSTLFVVLPLQVIPQCSLAFHRLLSLVSCRLSPLPLACITRVRCWRTIPCHVGARIQRDRCATCYGCTSSCARDIVSHRNPRTGWRQYLRGR